MFWQAKSSSVRWCVPSWTADFRFSSCFAWYFLAHLRASRLCWLRNWARLLCCIEVVAVWDSDFASITELENSLCPAEYTSHLAWSASVGSCWAQDNHEVNHCFAEACWTGYNSSCCMDCFRRLHFTWDKSCNPCDILSAISSRRWCTSTTCAGRVCGFVLRFFHQIESWYRHFRQLWIRHLIERDSLFDFLQLHYFLLLADPSDSLGGSCYQRSSPWTPLLWYYYSIDILMVCSTMARCSHQCFSTVVLLHSLPFHLLLSFSNYFRLCFSFRLWNNHRALSKYQAFIYTFRFSPSRRARMDISFCSRREVAFPPCFDNYHDPSFSALSLPGRVFIFCLWGFSFETALFAGLYSSIFSSLTYSAIWLYLPPVWTLSSNRKRSPLPD